MNKKIYIGSTVLFLATLSMFLYSSNTRQITNSEADKDISSLTIYSGRSESLIGPIIKQFQDATGIKTQVRYAGTAELAATLLEEGNKTPADIYLAQDPGGLGAVEDMLTPLPRSLPDLVLPQFRSPEGKWVALSGRARTVVYNTNKISESDLPGDIWDFVDGKWKGRIGWAPTNASFQTMITAMINSWGKEKTRLWLYGIKANEPKIYANNTSIVAAVGSGEIDVGLVNHYYLYRFIAEQGENFPARNYHPRAGGPGAIILVSGAGILESSTNKKLAERFLRFMLSPVAQQYFAGQTHEYPVIEGIKTNHLLFPLSQINSPRVGLKDLAEPKETIELLREVEIIP